MWRSVVPCEGGGPSILPLGCFVGCGVGRNGSMKDSAEMNRNESK